MKQTFLAGLAAAGLCLASSDAGAATFAGYTETADVYFDDAATFDYDPLGLGGSITDPGFLVDIGLSPGLSTGFLTLFDDVFTTVLDGTLVDTMLSVDGNIGVDTFSMLFSLSTGSQPYAVATFSGNLDGFGFFDFYTDGVLFEEGSLKIVGANPDDTAVIPLPAGVVLLISGLAAVGGLGAARRRRA